MNWRVHGTEISPSCKAFAFNESNKEITGESHLFGVHAAGDAMLIDLATPRGLMATLTLVVVRRGGVLIATTILLEVIPMAHASYGARDAV